jgi:16S rRNA A1518/A1519 N6-dimethyltransferase RsmA/KsgA/DIM1 with predicted DNA glycosylase/AP lyase activity
VSELIIPIVSVVCGISGLIYLSRGPIFLPTHRQDIDEMARILDIKQGDMAVDLGSGDGRIVIAMARAGAEAHGYENNPVLVWWSRLKIKKAGLSEHAFIHREDFWRCDFSKFNVVTVFGINYIMKRLESKILKEAKSGLKVISFMFPLPTLKPESKKGGIYFYRIP